MSNASNADQFGRPRTVTAIGLGTLIAYCAIVGSVWPSSRGSVWASLDTLGRPERSTDDLKPGDTRPSAR